VYGVAGLVLLVVLLGLLVQAAIASGPAALSVLLFVILGFALSALGVNAPSSPCAPAWPASPQV